MKRIFYDTPVAIDWKKHFYESMAKALSPIGIQAPKPHFWIPYNEDIRAMIPEDFLKGNCILIAPGGKRNIEAPKDYCWIFEGYPETIRHLITQGYQIIMTGASYDRAVIETLPKDARILDLVGKTTLSQLFTIVRQYARLVICNNSGLLHVACSMGIPTVSYADPQENMLRWGPYPDDGTHVYLQDTMTTKVTTEEFIRAIEGKLSASARTAASRNS